MKGKIEAICISPKRGVQKKPIAQAEIKENHGIVGDAHAAPGNRQISILIEKSIDKVKNAANIEIVDGDFAENIIISGIDLKNLSVGTKFKLNDSVIVEITQFGKECHDKCRIFEKAGICAIADEGIFVKTLHGGNIHKGDAME
ncbi:MAG: MOSC domain-containing protein, partial [Elusimicrobiota bacterium]|nr:MOSC domain-containing protein [Elusimicrobiota bacterium]